MDSTSQKKKLTFGAIRVVAAIAIEGNVVAYEVRDQFVNLALLTKLFDRIKQKSGQEKTFVFVDNLRLHYTKVNKAVFAKKNQQIVFNASYSS